MSYHSTYDRLTESSIDLLSMFRSRGSTSAVSYVLAFLYFLNY